MSNNVSFPYTAAIPILQMSTTEARMVTLPAQGHTVRKCWDLKWGLLSGYKKVRLSCSDFQAPLPAETTTDY